MNWLDRSRLLLSRLPIKDRENHRPTPFKFYPSQQVRFEKMHEQWESQKQVRIIDLKSRRVGFSSQTDALFWCLCLAYPNMNAKIVAHLVTSSEELFRVPADLARGFPGFPLQDIQQKRIYFRHRTGDSHLTVATAGTPAAGRGGTLSALHLSECAKYQDPEIFTAMISSVSKGPGSMIVLESTANGREGPGEAFAQYWDEAVKGANGYIPNFASWLEDPAFVRPAEEAEDAPADDLERELMAEPFNATREQIAWMRRTKADDCRNIEPLFLQDFPHCPEVAFQVSGQPAFARAELAYAQTSIHEPICRGRFIRTGSTPLAFRFEREENGPVHIWRFPFDAKGRPDGMKYYVGADSAAGVEEGDFASYCVLCGQTGELSARFAEIVDPEVFADQLDMVGRWYNTAIVNPELTGGLGRWTLVKLRDVFRYPNIYTWKGRDDRKRGRAKSSSLGFEMNQATRRLIVDAMRSGIRMAMRKEAGGLVVNDRALLGQMWNATLKEWRWEVARGHDDIMVAFAIACLTREQYPPARMTFAPKNVLEQTPQEKMAASGVAIQEGGVPGYSSEMNAIFVQELRKMMNAAGLRGNMRGSGRKSMNRLAGI